MLSLFKIFPLPMTALLSTLRQRKSKVSEMANSLNAIRYKLEENMESPATPGFLQSIHSLQKRIKKQAAVLEELESVTRRLLDDSVAADQKGVKTAKAIEYIKNAALRAAGGVAGAGAGAWVFAAQDVADSNRELLQRALSGAGIAGAAGLGLAALSGVDLSVLKSGSQLAGTVTDAAGAATNVNEASQTASFWQGGATALSGMMATTGISSWSPGSAVSGEEKALRAFYDATHHVAKNFVDEGVLDAKIYEAQYQEWLVKREQSTNLSDVIDGVVNYISGHEGVKYGVEAFGSLVDYGVSVADFYINFVKNPVTAVDEWHKMADKAANMTQDVGASIVYTIGQTQELVNGSASFDYQEISKDLSSRDGLENEIADGTYGPYISLEGYQKVDSVFEAYDTVKAVISPFKAVISLVKGGASGDYAEIIKQGSKILGFETDPSKTYKNWKTLWQYGEGTFVDGDSPLEVFFDNSAIGKAKEKTEGAEETFQTMIENLFPGAFGQDSGSGKSWEYNH